MAMQNKQRVIWNGKPCGFHRLDCQRVNWLKTLADRVQSSITQKHSGGAMYTHLFSKSSGNVPTYQPQVTTCYNLFLHPLPTGTLGCWNCCHKMAAKALRHYVSCSWPAACWISPGNNRSICQNCSKCITCSVAAIQFMAPCDNGAICEDRGKCPICSMNLLHMPQLNLNCRTAELSPPQFGLPQVTTDLSRRMAAKAPCFVAWICFTALNWSWTWELSPPSRLPQVTTDPSARAANAQNAQPVAWSCCTFRSCSWTLEMSPKCGMPQATTDLSCKIAANA